MQSQRSDAGQDCAAEARTRGLLARMDQRINSEDGAAGFDAYLALFAPGVSAWGLYEDGAADIARIREHYAPVFGGFRDSVLVSDELVVAGNMAAQRYHALFYLDGEFDGVQASNRLTAIRGQTFFRFDDEGLIAERWSNHDHAYRMAQLLGEKGRETGQALADKLNGTGPGEQAIYDALVRLREAFNHIEQPELRRRSLAALLAADMKGSNELLAALDAFWNAVPDATLHIDSLLSAWSMAALRWRIGGSLRADYMNHRATGKPVWLHGESILKFDTALHVETLWPGCIQWRFAPY